MQYFDHKLDSTILNGKAGAILADWVGSEVEIDFNLPATEWPLAGFPARAILRGVDRPMVLLDYHGYATWLNLSIIKSIYRFPFPEDE